MTVGDCPHDAMSPECPTDPARALPPAFLQKGAGEAVVAPGGAVGLVLRTTNC